MFLNFFFFLLLENLGAMAYPRYTGFREITDRDVLELHCILFISDWQELTECLNFMDLQTYTSSFEKKFQS